ncbi:MAG: hypothetical protein AB8H12_09730 [Lewinella sp.]
MAALTEGMAESIANYYSDIQYGDEHSRNSRTSPSNIIIGRYLNKAETLDFWDNCSERFIPEGLFFDLFDVNDVSPAGLALPEIEEIARLRSGINEDRIGGFTFNRQMDALNPFVFDIEGFKEKLFLQSGTITNTSRSDFDELFRAYGN